MQHHSIKKIQNKSPNTDWCRNLLDILLIVKFITNSKAAEKKKQNQITPLYIHWYFPWFSNKTNNQKKTVKQHCVIPQEKITIHDWFIISEPTNPAPASLKALYVYKSKPHDPWDSRQYSVDMSGEQTSVHWLLNRDLEKIKIWLPPIRTPKT